jgi:hypothetical protein
MASEPPTKKQRRQKKAAYLLQLLDPIGGCSPNPCELEALLDPDFVDYYRYLACRHYDDCIAIAGILKWEGFSCKLCEIYKQSNIAQRYVPLLRKVIDGRKK